MRTLMRTYARYISDFCYRISNGTAGRELLIYYIHDVVESKSKV